MDATHHFKAQLQNVSQNQENALLKSERRCPPSLWLCPKIPNESHLRSDQTTTNLLQSRRTRGCADFLSALNSSPHQYCYAHHDHALRSRCTPCSCFRITFGGMFPPTVRKGGRRDTTSMSLFCRSITRLPSPTALRAGCAFASGAASRRRSHRT